MMRPSVAGSSTSIIWIAPSFSITALGVRPRGQRLQPLFERDHQTVGEEGDEDVGLDPVLQLMVDGSDRQVALELLEDLFDLDQMQIEAPEVAGIVVGDVGAQEIAALAPPRLAQLFAVERETEGLGRDGLVLRRRFDRQQSIGLARLFLCRAELEQELVSSESLTLQPPQPLDQLAQAPSPHALFFFAPAFAAGEDIGFIPVFDELDPHAVAHQRGLSRASSAVRAACPRDNGSASARCASRRGRLRSGCRGP